MKTSTNPDAGNLPELQKKKNSGVRNVSSSNTRHFLFCLAVFVVVVVAVVVAETNFGVC